jgi:signal transduction histidine kinase
VGLYHPGRRQIEYRLAIEDGKRYTPYTRDTSDPDQLPVWCIEHRKPVFINDVQEEHSKYVSRFEDTPQRLEDGSMSKAPQSLIYLPLEAKDRVLGLITVQSFEKGAYTDRDLSVLQSLAAYTAVALDNAEAYRRLNEHEVEIRRLFEEAQTARAAAEEADAAKSAFLSTVSHELRTPLTSVLGFAKIIKKRLDERVFPLVPRDDARVARTVEQVTDNLAVVVSAFLTQYRRLRQPRNRPGRRFPRSAGQLGRSGFEAEPDAERVVELLHSVRLSAQRMSGCIA